MHEDYPIKIEETRQKALFFKSLYEALKESAEYIAFYSDLACKHLMHFNAKFAKKYRKIIADLDIAFSEISSKKLYDLEKMDYYLKHKEDYEKYAELPKYKLLNQTLLEKPIDLRFKRKSVKCNHSTPQ